MTDEEKMANAAAVAVEVAIEQTEAALDAVYATGIIRAQAWRNIATIAMAKAHDIEENEG